MSGNRVEVLPLKDQFKQALEEARVVLPGIQALFGFQLVAVFNSNFGKLSTTDQQLHLLALFLTALAVVSSMAPAALHRQTQPECVSDRLVRLSTCLLTFGMAPLGAGIVLDLYVVANVVTPSPLTSAGLASALALILFGTWFGFPWLVRGQLKSPISLDPSPKPQADKAA